jgi:hypothetical protein
VEDFLFQYSIATFLSRSYYITDISKIAMKVEYAIKLRRNLYPMWISLLKEEIEVFGKLNAKIYFVGEEVGNKLQNHIPHEKIAGTIIHYSSQAAKKRKELAKKHPNQFNDFCKRTEIDSEHILNLANKLLRMKIRNKQLRQEIINRLSRKGNFLTDSRKELLFTYYMIFTNTRVLVSIRIEMPPKAGH